MEGVLGIPPTATWCERVFRAEVGREVATNLPMAARWRRVRTPSPRRAERTRTPSLLAGWPVIVGLTTAIARTDTASFGLFRRSKPTTDALAGLTAAAHALANIPAPAKWSVTEDGFRRGGHARQLCA